MNTMKRGGRIVGVLLLTQMAAAAFVNFVLLGPVVFAAPGFLTNAAAHPLLMGLCALLGIAMTSLSLGIAITAFPVFCQKSQALALWFVALAAVSLSVSVVENINLMSLLSLSEAYSQANIIERELYATQRVIVAAARNWSHFLELILGGSTLLVFYAALYRCALIPRVMAALGMVAVLLQLCAVALPLFGHDVVFPMLAPLGLLQLAVAMWLIAKGWRDMPAHRTL
jgi:hypothetical protein